MPSSYAVFLTGAVLTAAALAWLMRAYRRADASAKPAPLLIACGAVIALTLGIYGFIGRPALADAPFAARLEALKTRDPSSFTAAEALAVLGLAAREHPRDPQPLLYAGQVLYQTGDAEAAARMFDAALRRDPTSTDAMLGLGRALVATQDGFVSDDALALFERASAASAEPAPWIYRAMAAMQAGRGADARRFWGEALTRMAPDDPRRAMAQRMSAGAN